MTTNAISGFLVSVSRLAACQPRSFARDRPMVSGVAITAAGPPAGQWSLRFCSTSDRTRISLVDLMRRELRIQAAFEPTRTGIDHIRDAYEVLVPLRRRRVGKPSGEAEWIEEPPADRVLRRRREEGAS